MKHITGSHSDLDIGIPGVVCGGAVGVGMLGSLLVGGCMVAVGEMSGPTMR